MSAQHRPPFFISCPDVNLSKFLFSNPFHKKSGLLDTPKELGENAFNELIPPEKPIFVDPLTGSQLSHGRLQRDSLRLAEGLVTKCAVQPAPYKPGKGQILSPVVLMIVPNSVVFPSIMFGVLAASLTVTMANPLLTPTELAHILSISRPSVIFCHTMAISSLQAAFSELKDSEVSRRFSGKSKYLFTVSPTDYYGTPSSLPPNDWTTLLAGKEHEIRPFQKGEAKRRVAYILWSSGTSGKSKGVVLSHEAGIFHVVSLRWGHPEYSGPQRFLALPPFYHIYALANILCMCPAVGITATIVHKFDPVFYLSLVQKYKITHLHIAPPVAVLMAKSPILESFDLSSVEAMTSGGAPLSPHVIKEVYHRLGLIIHMGYGASETGGNTTVGGENWDEVERMLGSCGKFMPGQEGLIVEVGTRGKSKKVLGIEEEGELLIRSPGAFMGYLNSPESTADTLEDEGWVHSGDVGKFDKHGNLWLTDRIKEMIKVKGFQVSPADLESILCECDLVADAGVSSIYDEQKATEWPKAWVVISDKKLLETVLKRGSSCEESKAVAMQIRKFVETRTVHYKWPRGGLVFVEAIPKSPSGKILRRLLKDTKGVEVSMQYEDDVRAKL
ncbi:acetyl-CoA synthetase-like protein [Atractiella rhizophila]|nr:acetyl-CoA synthetase-like protein [Atractiella rhizophila]